MERSNARCVALCALVSTWPYMMVEVVRRPSLWAVSISSTHCAVVIRPGAITSRTSSTRISADVPGRLSSPASCSARRYSATLTPASSAP